ncbi:ECs_2282 family putative zinc-binding protein [Budvicia diplopodorum]|uniref:ECs_2282 family putative zinc-binding protein n=1 Tax=Budvicia diplopodorum TaxID=1119056 RepID=UPI003CCD11CA
MPPQFKFYCSKCGSESFRATHEVNSLNDIQGAICSRCYKPVEIGDITEQKIRRIQLIIERKITSDTHSM